MTEIERMFNDAMALPNINNGNPLNHNDDLCRHRIVILLEVVNDAAPWYKPRTPSQLQKTKSRLAFVHASTILTSAKQKRDWLRPVLKLLRGAFKYLLCILTSECMHNHQ